jgi:hypothetical protein
MAKLKKCKNCKLTFEPQRSLQYLCAPKCAAEYAFKKAREKEQLEWRTKHKAMKEKLKTLSDYEKLARIVFQKWVRQRDQGLPCISCNNVNPVQWHAGHYFQAELYSGMIFNEDNVHAQCSRCNDLYSGNLIEYRIGLINRYGEQFVIDLEAVAKDKRVYKYTKEELIEIAKHYKSLLIKK